MARLARRRHLASWLLVALLTASCAGDNSPSSTTEDVVDELVDAVAEECGYPLDPVEEPVQFAACVVDADVYFGVAPVGTCGFLLEEMLPDELVGMGSRAADSTTRIVNGIPILDFCRVSAQGDYLTVDLGGVRALVPDAHSFYALETGHCYRSLPSGALLQEVRCDDPGSSAEALLLVGVAAVGGCESVVSSRVEDPPINFSYVASWPTDAEGKQRDGSRDWCFVEAADFRWEGERAVGR